VAGASSAIANTHRAFTEIAMAHGQGLKHDPDRFTEIVMAPRTNHRDAPITE
jgi:hypothetical protein